MATAAKTAETVTSQFTTASDKALKSSIEKSIAAFGEVNVHSKKNLDAVVASMTAAAKGAEALSAHAIAYSKKSVEDQVASAKTFAGAKSLQEVFELQTAFAKTAFENYVAEVSKMTETFAASVRESMSPINERVTAMVETAQASR